MSNRDDLEMWALVGIVAMVAVVFMTGGKILISTGVLGKATDSVYGDNIAFGGQRGLPVPPDYPEEIKISRYAPHRFWIPGLATEFKIGIKRVDTKVVLFSFLPMNSDFVLRKSETRKFDLDGDGDFDVSIGLISYSEASATILFSKPVEEVRPVPKVIEAPVEIEKLAPAPLKEEEKPGIIAQAVESTEIKTKRDWNFGMSGKSWAFLAFYIVVIFSVFTYFQLSDKPDYR
ncbi:hypothetical protein GOV11_03880 [Candidatus Woesearchaeota archaeon]|nr:hypothetical protein [Candidatus Woesearchaeota archaeon]